MNTLNKALIDGDGIGPEVIEQAVKVSDAIAKRFNHNIQSIENKFTSFMGKSLEELLKTPKDLLIPLMLLESKKILKSWI